MQGVINVSQGHWSKIFKSQVFNVTTYHEHSCKQCRGSFKLLMLDVVDYSWYRDHWWTIDWGPWVIDELGAFHQSLTGVPIADCREALRATIDGGPLSEIWRGSLMSFWRELFIQWLTGVPLSSLLTWVPRRMLNALGPVFQQSLGGLFISRRQDMLANFNATDTLDYKRT